MDRNKALRFASQLSPKALSVLQSAAELCTSTSGDDFKAEMLCILENAYDSGRAEAIQFVKRLNSDEVKWVVEHVDELHRNRLAAKRSK